MMSESLISTTGETGITQNPALDAFLSREIVRSLYRTILGREPDAGGWEKYAREMEDAGTIETVVAELLGSAEFQYNNFRHLAPGLIQALYKALLGRNADPAGVETYSQRLAMERNLEGLLTDLMTSKEYLARQRDEIANYLGGGKEIQPAETDIAATKTIFLHIPKTGGTTIHAALDSYFAPERRCPERFNSLHRYSAGELAGYRVFSGHFSLISCELIPGPKRIFTMLRDPVERLISLYNFQRFRGDVRDLTLARTGSMRDYFLEDAIQSHWSINNAMVRALTISPAGVRWDGTVKCTAENAMDLLPQAKEALHSLATFGILERFDESVALIFKTLGFGVPAAIKPQMVLKDLVKKADGSNALEPEVCDEETREVIALLTEADLALYEYGVKLFEERVATKSEN
jgi:hypothetical protein